MRLLKIGRDPACDIVLHSPKASSLHAEITILNNGDILLEDKHSRNGTFVMNHPVKPGTQISIKRGDAIRFGDVELIWDQVPQSEDLSQYKAVYGIGSSMRNEVQLTGNTVSRYHATLKVDKKGKAYLQDHSKNGSTVNGERLMNGQTRQVKRGDSIVCGGVPVNLAPHIPSNNLMKIIGIVAAACITGFGIWGFAQLLDNSTEGPVNPVTSQALENASACVYGGYYYEVSLKDDPFQQIVEGWPEKWYIGYDSQGKLNISGQTDNLNPIGYNGTAFFISKEGEMGTNRHIAVPWEYRSPQEEEQIKQLMQQERERRKLWLAPRLNFYMENGLIPPDEVIPWFERFDKSPLNDISGKHEFFGVGLTGSKINNQIDLQQAQVIAESGDPKKDVALIRLNSRKTPDYLIQMGAIYDISKARTDETQLQPQKEELSIIGYPMGEIVSNQLFDGKELRPTIHNTKLSRVPDDNQMQIQTTGVGGMSGSPISDENHRLVGVLCSGFGATEVTYGCNIKHLVELYEKNKVRE